MPFLGEAGRRNKITSRRQKGHDFWTVVIMHVQCKAVGLVCPMFWVSIHGTFSIFPSKRSPRTAVGQIFLRFFPANRTGPWTQVGDELQHMLSMLRMKSLVFSGVSTLSPYVTKATPFSIYFHASKSILCNSHTLKNPSFLHVKSKISFSKPLMSSSSFQSRSFQIESSQSCSGEIHVIVGPMFAGKTTTLLRRIQSESSNGRWSFFFF